MKSLGCSFFSVVFVLNILFISSCNAQNKDTTQNKPKIDIKVNKQYDQNGNVIGYDSTYSYSFSSNGSNFQLNNGVFMNDSLFNNGSLFNDQLFNNFFPDPSFRNDSDYFMNFGFFDIQFQNHMKQINEMMQKMQSMPGPVPSPEIKKEKSTDPEVSKLKKEISL